MGKCIRTSLECRTSDDFCSGSYISSDRTSGATAESTHTRNEMNVIRSRKDRLKSGMPLSLVADLAGYAGAKLSQTAYTPWGISTIVWQETELRRGIISCRKFIAMFQCQPITRVHQPLEE